METVIKTDWKVELKKLKLDSIKKKTPAAFEASGGYSMDIIPYSDKKGNVDKNSW